MNPFNIVDMITKKRDGQVLSNDEIQWAVSAYARGEIPDYQMSAFLMAVYFQGMNSEEIRSLTRSMIASGETIDLSDIPGIKVDKHSTGGVGDKISLILAPLVAAAGVPVPMMSGRGLGHTGGTLDKLESIPGFRTRLSDKEFRKILHKAGFAMMGQTEQIVPADRKMYALRDVTGTVPSIPLICASIISKKKAEGADALVLDVKMGKGAFLKSDEETRKLAHVLVRLGNALSMRTVALLTAMDEPLGYAVGNWLEVRESLDCLRGKGPADVMEIVFALGGIMLMLGGKASSVKKGSEMIQKILYSGEGFQRFIRMTEMQGGDVPVLNNPDSYPGTRPRFEVTSPVTGYVSGIDSRKTGLLSVALGAGRLQMEDPVDPAAGILLYKKKGDAIKQGDPLAALFTHKISLNEDFQKRLLECFSFSKTGPEPQPVIFELIDTKKEIKYP